MEIHRVLLVKIKYMFSLRMSLDLRNHWSKHVHNNFEFGSSSRSKYCEPFTLTVLPLHLAPVFFLYIARNRESRGK
jgi:hypothetical protein